MFDVTAAIEAWKIRLGSIDSLRCSDVVELESHLRESMAALGERDLSEEEAFIIASRRLGHPGELDGEYCKINGPTIWKKRLVWMLSGTLAYIVSSVSIAAVASVVSCGISCAGLGGKAAGVIALAILALGWIVLIGLAFRLSKRTSPISECKPHTWCVLAALVVSVSGGLKIVANVLRAQFVSRTDLVEAHLWQSAGGLAVYAIVFIACAVLVCVLTEFQRDRTEAFT